MLTAISSQRIPAGPGEFRSSQPSLHGLSCVCCTKGSLVYTQPLCEPSMLDTFGQLEPDRCNGSRGTSLLGQRPRAGKPGVCGDDAVLILFAAVGESKCAVGILRADLSTWIASPPAYQGAGRHKQWCFPALPSRTVPAAPGELRWFPSLLCLVSSSRLWFRSCAFSPPLSLSHCFMCRFHCALGRGLVQHPPGLPPSWTSHLLLS